MCASAGQRVLTDLKMKGDMSSHRIKPKIHFPEEPDYWPREKR
jgi:hypothetical protein